MKRTQLENGGRIHVLDFASADMPHATLETNHTCNLECTFCYNRDRETVKSLPLLLEELKTLQQYRPRLHTITLLGGEPLLHPGLPALVRAVRGAGKLCQVMTNGVVFMEKNGPARLEELVRAGVNRFALHVDEGQGDAVTVRNRRLALYRMMEERKIHFSLTVTMTEETAGSVPALIREGAPFRYFGGILGFMATDQESPLRPETRLPAEHGAIIRELGTEPNACVPSSLDRGSIRWLLYHMLIDRRTGKAMAVSPRFTRFFNGLFRRAAGRYPFMLLLGPAAAAAGSLFTWLLEFFLHPPSALSALRTIGGPAALLRARFVFIAVGVPPETGTGNGPVDFCSHCPDATIRNGRLMPVCIADLISPLPGPADIPPRYQPVLDRLEDRD